MSLNPAGTTAGRRSLPNGQPQRRRNDSRSAPITTASSTSTDSRTRPASRPMASASMNPQPNLKPSPTEKVTGLRGGRPVGQLLPRGRSLGPGANPRPSIAHSQWQMGGAQGSTADHD